MRDRWSDVQDNLRSSRQRRRGRRKLSVLVFATLVAVGYALGRMAPWMEEPAPRSAAHPEAARASAVCREILCQVTWPSPSLGADSRYEEWLGENRVVYTLDPELQEQAEAVFRQYRVPYGALVAIEPATGRILALVEFSREEPDLQDFARRATYPAASLVKVITAAAALETGRFTPASQIRFEGNPYRLYPRKLSADNRRRENNVSSLAEALGKSNNVVYAKVGVELGPQALEASLRRFGFNQAIPFDFSLQESHASVPTETYPLGRTAAGFGEVYLSPVHAALISAAIANGGKMMRPYVVERLEDSRGRTVYQASPEPLGEVTPEAIARQVAQMMERTVTNGTSARVFRRYARKLRSLGVAGKTGSLTGEDPPGRYEWFIGFAPLEEPQLAVASLVVNHDLWHIKGTYAAQAVMREFFGF